MKQNKAWIWLLSVWFLATGCLMAQTSTLRDTVVAVNPAGQLVDSLTVVPNSLEVTTPSGASIATDGYMLNGRFLSWRDTDLPDSVRLRYRVLPFTLDERVRLLDSAALQSEEAGLVIGGYDDYVRSGLLDNNSKVRTTGSFSRAISFGNRQDLVLNSAFNLQMDGELGNGIEVSAAITDESLPVQPEGTTQQLREFDKIFIQLRKNRTQLTAGDYELRHPDGYFLRYFKKLEGATFTTVSEDRSRKVRGADVKRNEILGAGVKRNGILGAGAGAGLGMEGSGFTSTASVAVARGQFIRQQIQPVEGNQGPYKLTGNGTQRFLIILAGTERIFLDGNLLVRGLDGDYTIDYNLAELTFTTRRLITRDSRITAEYEFADQRYVRTLATGGTRYENRRFSAYVNGYTQQDSRTATGDLELTAGQRQQLSLAGDLPGGIPILSLDTLDGRSELRATYTLVDTTYRCGDRQLDTVFLRAATEGRYVATFTDRGPNGGEYALDPDRPANERVFNFVGSDPLTCLPNGNFAPLIDLTAPEQQQLLAVGGAYRFGETGGSLRLEGSRSKLDLNRFSRQDGQDDNGHALRMDLDRNFTFGPDSSGWVVAPRAHFEFVEETYNFINPYRSPEFFRNWNLSNRLGTVNPDRQNERIGGLGVGLLKSGLGRADYEFEYFSRGTTYLGKRQVGAVDFLAKGWRVDGKVSFLESEDDRGSGSFRQPTLKITKAFPALGGWSVSGTYQGERSLRQASGVDTLSPFSFQFDRYTAGMSAPGNDRYRFGLSANRRTDRLPKGSELVTSTEATEVTAEGNYTASKFIQFGGNFTYRDLNIADRELVDDTPSRTFLGRLDLRTNALQRSLRTQTTYQVGSGQEPRVDFQYLYVGPGQGQYIWQDTLYNNDGKIQPNEMEISPFPDIADYVRVSVFTNDFIRTDNVALNQKINWDPVRIWREAQGLRKNLRRFSFNTNLRIDRKTRQDEAIQSWNPLQLAVADSSLVTLSLSRRHGLFFNRANPKYDIQIANADRRNRRVLTTGYESSRREEWTLRFRFRPHDQLSLEAAGETGRREADSEFFNNKDYRFRFTNLEPSINWQPGELRLVTKLILGTEENILAAGEGERTDRLELQFEGNYKNWLTTRLRWVDITLEGDARSPVGFALLQGLQPGRNLLWNLGATRQLGQYLQLTVSYEGRQTGEAKTVHVGRAQVQAFF